MINITYKLYYRVKIPNYGVEIPQVEDNLE